MAGKISMKIYKISNEVILAAADYELSGKSIREGKLHITVSEEFYGNLRVPKNLFLESLELCTIANLVGKFTVESAISAGFVERENVIFIDGVPHCQYAKMMNK